jgi:hypothetical protein
MKRKPTLPFWAASASEFESSLASSLVQVAIRSRLRRLVPVRQPLVLVSQVQRSGGTLLSQLFDGHPEVHAHPSELTIGKKKRLWPALDLSAKPAALFDSLYEEWPDRHAAVGGYFKPGSNPEPSLLPFIWSRKVQLAIFKHALAQFGRATQRSVIDAFMTSYFGAWLDYQGMYRSADSVRLVTAFAAGLSVDPQQVAAFFADYPDGKLISIIRNPTSWFASASRHRSPKFGQFDLAISKWLDSTNAAIRNKSAHPESTLLLRFEDLVGDVEGTMRIVADFVGVSFHPSMLVPTMNTMPIRANTSFTASTHGILPDAADRSHLIDERVGEEIASRCSATYTAALALVLRPGVPAASSVPRQAVDSGQPSPEAKAGSSKVPTEPAGAWRA